MTARLVLPLLIGSALALGQGFDPGCELPFKKIKSDGLAIDASCPIDGNAGDLGKQLESKAKNNFCAPGTPVPITFPVFTRLQTASDAKADLRKTLKTDRSVLAHLVTVSNQSVGEGTKVRFVAFILDAHNSNAKKQTPPKKDGELVNCNTAGNEANDIHIELVKDPKEDDGCNSLTAEMSPHFRPASWSDLVNISIKRPVRVTGPLFYDGISHTPCHDNKRPNPHRISVWEIHPVYELEVCKKQSLQSCKVGDNTAWITLDEWHKHEEDEEEDDQ